MTLRDQRQEEFARIWLKHKFGILYLCPRFGKIRVAINIMKEIKPNKVLIAYPDNKIKVSWENEFEIVGYTPPDVTFTNYASLDKHIIGTYDLIIFDEIHDMSPRQIGWATKLLLGNPVVLGLTGTLSKDTTKWLRENLRLSVLAEYSTAQAIEEKVLPDYTIKVMIVPLDNKIQRSFGKKYKTEKKAFDDYTWVIDKQEQEGRNTKFMRLNRMRVLQGSLAKRQTTINLLKKFERERVLVFCGTVTMADNLGIPSYHSKSSEKNLLEDFAQGIGNQLAVIKIGNVGVTYKPLNIVIVNYFDSNPEDMAQKINRCMSMEYNNPDKRARIYIVCTNEDVELRWLKRALSFFDKEKIEYVSALQTSLFH